MILTLMSGAVFAQTTEFTYQGSLTNASVLADGNYDFEFLLLDAMSGGTHIGATIKQTSVAVTDGTFAVKLNFGANFPGATRFLEFHVRQTGGGGFTPLTLRQAVTSAPGRGSRTAPDDRQRKRRNGRRQIRPRRSRAGQRREGTTSANRSTAEGNFRAKTGKRSPPKTA